MKLSARWQLDPVLSTGVLLTILAVSAFPLLSLRPNRMLSGRAVYLAVEALPWLLTMLAIAGAVLFLSRRRTGSAYFPAPVAVRPGHAQLIWQAGAGLLLLYGLFAVAGGLAAIQVAEGGRASLGSGFWLALPGIYVILHDAAGRLGRRRGFLVWLLAAAGLVLMLAGGGLSSLSVLIEFSNRRDSFIASLAEHLFLAGFSTLLAFVTGFVLALLARAGTWLERIIFAVMNTAQTIPTLSLLGLLILPLSLLAERYPALAAAGLRGIGPTPAIIALFLYALLPIAGNILAGLRSVDASVREAAAAMGMTATQIFLRVELPLALPLIVGGVRTALTQSIGNAILAGLIGGGGLGALIFLGLAQAAPDLVLLGALPVAALALAADRLLGLLARYLGRRTADSGVYQGAAIA